MDKNLKNLIIFILSCYQGKISPLTKLRKLIFLIDRYFAYKYGKPLTCIKYRNAYFGPYSEEIDNALKSLEKEGIITIEDVTGENTFYQCVKIANSFILVNPFYKPELDKETVRELQEFIRPYLNRSLDDILNEIYELPEYQNTPLGEEIKFPEKPVKQESKDQKISSLALILGAVDGDVIKSARRLVHILKAYQWALAELLNIIDASKDPVLISAKERILEELRKELNV
jgi:uncharacterized protein YwgA